MEIISIGDRELIILKENIKKELRERGITPLKEFEIKNQKECFGCGKTISRKAKRCSKCAGSHRDNSKMGENFKIMKGKDNPRWVNGRRSYRKLIKIVKCSKCPSKERLEVHHKDKDRNNNHKDNLEVLCRSCHTKKHPRNLEFGENGNFKKRGKHGDY